MKDLKMESKFRIVKDGKKAFGIGPCILLERVDRLGSLNKACKELNMSYSKGWSIINNAETLLDIRLLESQTGGIDGGGSYLTSEARVLVRAYKDFSNEAEEILHELFQKHFGLL